MSKWTEKAEDDVLHAVFDALYEQWVTGVAVPKYHVALQGDTVLLLPRNVETDGPAMRVIVSLA